MKIITPRPFVPAQITTNVALTETAWTAGTYTLGTRRYDPATFDFYEVVVASTSDAPAVGYAAEVKTWDRVGKVNRFACFDQIVGNAMSGTDLDMTIAADGTVTNGLAIFNATGGAVRVTVTDPTDGVVYDETVSLVDNAGIASWYDWFFAPIITKPDFVLLDLPLYASASIRIRITGAFSIGELVLGQVADVGVATFGTQVGILDFSRKDRDTFGNSVLIQRAFSKRVQYTAHVPTGSVYSAQRMLTERRALPTVYIGSENFPETIVYGFFRDFTITLAGPGSSDCAIEVEGLV